MSVQIVNIYESGRTTRYHANYKFNYLLQNNADHQWGCTAIVMALHPDPSVRLLKRAHFHDGGEFKAGDLPYPFKIENPGVAAAHAVTEYKMAADAGIPGIRDELTEEEEKWVKFADRFESFLFALFHRPEVLSTPGWTVQTEAIRTTAKELGVYDKIKEVLE